MLRSDWKKQPLVLREPSLDRLDPKGGSTGGGYAQVVFAEEINLHFAGDYARLNDVHKSSVCNHWQSHSQGNELQIDTSRRILWKRALDLNDRSLRQIEIGLGGPD